jgi:hypothetical protein
MAIARLRARQVLKAQVSQSERLAEPLSPQEEKDRERRRATPAWAIIQNQVLAHLEKLASEPRIVLSEAEHLIQHALLNRRTGYPFAAISDAPMTCAQIEQLTGVSSRAPLKGLVRKGVLHSYGRQHGYVHTAFLHQEPGRRHWLTLTMNQRKILALFFSKPWRLQRDGTEIAHALGRCFDEAGRVGDSNIRKEIRSLVGCHALKPVGSKGGGYQPDPRGWPTDAPGIPFCPAVDVVESLIWERKTRQERAVRLQALEEANLTLPDP